jgi:phosphoglycerate dehydrogenase-like enzyme
MVKLLCLEPAPTSLLDWFGSMLPAGVELDCVEDDSDEELCRRAANAEMLLSPGRRIDARLLALAPRARFVQLTSIGYDNVDIAAVHDAGVLAAYCPGACAVAVAEHTIMLMLVLLKRTVAAEQGTRAGDWPAMELAGRGLGDLASATIGLVGLGHIGRAVAERLAAFGAKVCYTARHPVDPATEERLGARYVPFDELLASSNIVSLHLPLTPETRHMIGAPQLARMRGGSLLVNTARGPLIDDDALRGAIQSGRLAGAALDVLEREEPGGNPFADLPQVLVTPHVASMSRGGIAAVFVQTCANIARYVNGETPHDLIPGTTAAGSA